MKKKHDFNLLLLFHSFYFQSHVYDFCLSAFCIAIYLAVLSTKCCCFSIGVIHIQTTLFPYAWIHVCICLCHTAADSFPCVVTAHALHELYKCICMNDWNIQSNFFWRTTPVAGTFGRQMKGGAFKRASVHIRQIKCSCHIDSIFDNVRWKLWP